MQMRNFGKIALASGIAMLASGCEYIPDFEDNSHPLTRVTWQLDEVITEGGTTRLSRSEMERHTLDFGEDGQVLMQLDCNRGSATWNAPEPVRGGGTMNIGMVAATRALCPEPTYGEDLALDLPSATNYMLMDGNGRLRINARRVSYVFRAR